MKKDRFSFSTDITNDQSIDNIKLNWIQKQVIGSKFNELQTQLEDKQTQIVESEKQNQKLQKDFDNIMTKYQESLDKLKDHALLIDKLRREQEQLISPVENLKKELEESKNEIRLQKKNCDDLSKLKNKLENDILSLNQKIKELELYNNDIKIKNEKSKKNIDDLYQENNELRDKIDKDSERYNKELNQLKFAWEEKEAFQKAESDTLRQSISRLEVQLADEQHAQETSYQEAQDIINDLRQEQSGLQKQLESIQEECCKITNEKIEADHRTHVNQEEMHDMQARLEQYDYDMQNQYQNLNIISENYRKSINYLHISSSIALHQTLGEFSSALSRSVYMSYAHDLLDDYHHHADAVEAVQAYGQWLMDMQLCTNVSLHHEEDMLSCSWDVAPTNTVSTAHTGMTYELVIGMLWALLSTKTAQQWRCHREWREDAKSMQVIFRRVND